MIASLSGTLLDKRAEAAVVEAGGVGYLVHVSQRTLLELPPVGTRLTLRVHTHVREDALQLFGFLLAEEETLFHLLLSVNGVGPRLAINILGGMQARELSRAIAQGELARLTKIPGVGKKTAERLVLELKEKVGPAGLLGPASEAGLAGAQAASGALVSALINLGYKPAAAERTAEAVERALGPEAGLDAQLREALRRIQGAA